MRRTKSIWFATGALAIVAAGGCHVAATGHNMEGKRLYEQGQYNAAIGSFQEAVQDDPENADAHYNMAAVYHRLATESGNHDYVSQAEQLYRRAIELDTGHVDAYRGLAVMYVQTGQTSVAFDLMESWVIRQPESADPRIELARLYKEHGDSVAARDHLAAALNNDANNPRALAALGQIHEEQGDVSQAMWMYENAYRQNSLQPQLTAHMASLRQSLGAGAGQTSVSGPGTRVVNAGSLPLRY